MVETTKRARIRLVTILLLTVAFGMALAFQPGRLLSPGVSSPSAAVIPSQFPIGSGSWNPHVACSSPWIVRITDITDNMTGSASLSNSLFTPGINSSAGLAKRWLTAGPTPPGWVSPGPPCAITNSHGLVAVFVEIDNIKFPFDRVWEDCRIAYDPINGGTAFPSNLASKGCDSTANAYDPSIINDYDDSCRSATDPTCYARIHTEIDGDWQVAGYAGPTTSYDNNITLAQAQAAGQHIDIQGYVYWDPENTNQAWHSFSGWEIHPMTAWRIHQPPPDFSISASPASLTAQANTTSNSTISLASINNFTGTVTLSQSSSPQGLNVALNPTSLTLSPGGANASTLSVSSAALGNYTVTVTATSANLSHSVTVMVSITPPPNFAISASPTSLTLRQPSSGVSSPATVGLTGDPSFFESSYLASSFYAKGLYWLFYEDSRNTCEHQSGCLTYTTSPNGSKWASPITVPVHIADSDFSVYTDGASVYYVRYNETSFESTCGRNIQFGLGTLSAYGTVAWQQEQTIAIGASDRSYPNDEIIVDSNGQVWIGYMIASKVPCGGDGIDRPEIIHSAGTNYASWTGNTTLSTALSDNWHVALVSLGSGKIYASYWIANHDLHGRLFNGTRWGSDEQISTVATRNDVNAWLFNSGTSIYTVYFDNATETYNFASRSSNGVWTISLIGTGETHTGNVAFSSSYYSLPDSASYDMTENQLYLFYMNSTNRLIDEWRGLANTWTKTTGIVNTTAVPYPDSISSFIQSSATITGAVFYTSGASPPFTINAATMSFTANGSTGSFTVSITSQNGFMATVDLSVSTSPLTGLMVSCSPTTIAGGAGTSNCNLNSMTPGTYTVTLTGVSGSLSHTASTTVQTVDFRITGPSLLVSPVGTNTTSTIILTSLNGYSGNVTLTAATSFQPCPAGGGGRGGAPLRMVSPQTLPSLSLSPISILLASGGTGQSSLTIVISTSVAACNYPIIVTASDGTIVHRIQFTLFVTDFSLNSPTYTITATVGSVSNQTLTLVSLNGFQGNITLSTSVSPSGPSATLNPFLLYLTSSGSTLLTISLPSNAPPGTYTLIVRATSGSLSHSISITINAQSELTTLERALVSDRTLSLGIVVVVSLFSLFPIHRIGVRRKTIRSTVCRTAKKRRAYYGPRRQMANSRSTTPGAFCGFILISF